MKKRLFLVIIGLSIFFLCNKSAVHAATFTVTTTTDAVDTTVGDGICATNLTQCSLRAAVQEANTTTGTDTIILPAGNFVLTIAGRNEDGAATGDLDIVIPESLIIQGSGTGVTIIDGNGIDRIFDIKSNIGTPITEVTLNNLTIQNGNPGANSGGGIQSEGYLTLDNVVVKDNLIEDTLWGGGGIAIYSGRLTINNTTIDGNTGHAGGGIVLFDDTQFISTNSTISNNVSPEDIESSYSPGGGIMGYDNVLVNITNTTISGNLATEGGGLYLSSNTNGFILNTTITNNTTTANGAGLYGNWGESVPDLKIKNTILSGNNGQNCFSTESITDGYNLYFNNIPSDPDSCIFDATGDINNADLFIGQLQSNGGVTFTHALELTSPAIDSANNDGCPSTDQRGSVRPFDANADSVATCDIGAYEYSISATPTLGPTLTVIPTLTFTPTPTMSGITPTSIITPTIITIPSPTSSSVSNSSSSTNGENVLPSHCADIAPTSIVDIFKIERNRTTATLYFAPLGAGTTYYYISYGTDTNAEGYGVQFDNLPKEGVISYTIHELDPTTQYYFKVRGGSGCAPSPWSSVKSSIILPLGMPNTGR